MIYNQILSNGRRDLNIQYDNVDKLYSNRSCNVVILEKGLPLTISQYRNILPNFYTGSDSHGIEFLPSMYQDSVMIMLKELKLLGFVSLKKECKVFNTFFQNESVRYDL